MAESYSHSTPDLLSEARFQFALKSMQTLTQIKQSENIVFSPYSIYEGLLLVYFASSGHTEIHLKRILELPEDISKEHWMLHSRKERSKENREKSNGYYDENSCWITNTKIVNDMTQRLFKKELEIVGFDKAFIHLMNRINELLKMKTQDYMHEPVKLKSIHEKMEIILSTVICFKGDTVKPDTDLPTEHLPLLEVLKETSVLSTKLGMFVTELPYVGKNLSLFLLFPLQPVLTNKTWIINEDITALIERLTTKEGINELRKVLNNQVPSTEKLSAESAINPDFFELENELPIDQLLEILGIRELLEPDKANLSNFTDENLHLGGAMHRAYIKVTPKNVTVGAINMFFIKNEGSFKTIGETDRSECKNVFLWLLFCKDSQTILLIGANNKKSQSASRRLARAVSSLFKRL